MAKWVARLRSNARVEVTRGGVSECRPAILSEDDVTRREVYSLFQSKYREPLDGSRLLGLLFGSDPDPDEAERSGVLFRLDPRAADAAHVERAAATLRAAGIEVST